MAEKIFTWFLMVICAIILLAYVVSLAFGQGLSPWFLVGTGVAGVAVYYRNATRRR